MEYQDYSDIETRPRNTHLISTRYNQADHEDTSDVEHKDTEERTPDSDWDVFPGCLSFTHSNTDQLGSDVSKERVDQSTPETKEDRETLSMDLIFQIMTHGAIRRVPVTETNTVMFGVSS